MKFFVLLSTLLLISCKLYAQPVPLNMQDAYEQGTRSYDGKPGINYWTNHADYSIKVSLDPESRLVSGKAVITYFNNSPDTLRQIVLRLYPDLFRKGGVRDWPVNPVDLHDGVNINHLSINAVVQNLDSDENIIRRRGTNMFLHLEVPLPPADQLIMGINWNYNLPDLTPFRMGKYDSSSFFVAYWYPQIAVYDDIDGWDQYNYGGLQEFYNDANNFDVRITVPENFVVWATGVLQNPKNLLPDPLFQRYQKALQSDSTIHILDSAEVKQQKFTINPNGQSWRFKAQDVPDFAFATSDHYLWDMNSLVVDSTTNRRVTVQAAYKKESRDFYEVADISRASIHYFSTELPAVPFPYPELTVFNGGGGMEFPMMVNDGSAQRRSGTVHVTSHEIAHTYFPFYTGTNERKYAWMDEGWATMLPFVIQNRLEPSYDPIVRSINRYVAIAGHEFDIPMVVPSIVYGPNAYRPSYRNAAYDRPGVAYLILQNALGEELFLKAIQEFIGRWHHKHPIPNDFFYTFNDVAEEDLSWFWKPWFFEFGYPDLGIKEIRETKSGTEIIVEKIGSHPVPIMLEVEINDERKILIEKSAAVWKTGNTEVSVPLKYPGRITNIILGNKHIPDVNPDNNRR